MRSTHAEENEERAARRSLIATAALALRATVISGRWMIKKRERERKRARVPARDHAKPTSEINSGVACLLRDVGGGARDFT